MADKHLSSQFDSELGQISQQVMALGGLVEAQIAAAARAAQHLDVGAAATVRAAEAQVNALEVDIDLKLTTIIARRQPTARDLRLLVAFSKATANLERMGDEADKIARLVQMVAGPVGTGGVAGLPAGQLQGAGALASALLRKALDALARLDTGVALEILKEDDLLDAEFTAFVRQLIDCMVRDAQAIPAGLELLLIAKALERIGDHAKNVAELVIYLVRGVDVRHQSVQAVEQTIRHPS